MGGLRNYKYVNIFLFLDLGQALLKKNLKIQIFFFF